MSQIRKYMRYQSITTAAAMIDELDGGGLTYSDTDLTEKEFELFLAENKKLAKQLNRKAEKIYQSLLAEGYLPKRNDEVPA